MKKTIVVCAKNHSDSAEYVGALKHTAIDGEEVLVVTPEDRRDDLRQLGTHAAGLVLCGGPDIEPWRYGEDPRGDAHLTLVPELDATEWPLIEGAQEAKTPTWAICRGVQVLNVFLGGTLWQDLPSQVPGVANHDITEPLDHLAHTVAADGTSDSETAFGELLASEIIEVNTRHHQAVREVAPSLRAVASSPDGVIEAVEGRTDWWLRGVQWHPENLLSLAIQRKLWHDFIRVALKKATSTSRRSSTTVSATPVVADPV